MWYIKKYGFIFEGKLRDILLINIVLEVISIILWFIEWIKFIFNIRVFISLWCLYGILLNK